MHVVCGLRCLLEADVCCRTDEVILIYNFVGILYTRLVNVFKPRSTTFVISVVSCYPRVEDDMGDSIDNLTEDWRTVIHIEHAQHYSIKRKISRNRLVADLSG